MIYSKNYQDAAVQAQFESLWQCIWQKLFCSKTNLFYDTLPGNDLIENLPLPEEIALQVPNPCGWGTGMEDSMLNAGNMLLASLNRYDSEADERFAEQARKVFAGMALCASVGKSQGYLARSVSPFDCKSYYINSSRDQYTHFVYSAYIYYNHKLCSGNDRALIKKFLTDFAERCLQNVTAENNYDLLRDDGKIGMVSQMDGEICPHEALRLGMIYLAAWKVSGDERFAAAYHAGRTRWLELTESITFECDWLAFALLQMQYSLRLIWMLDDDESVKIRLLKVMQKTADYAQRYICRNHQLLQDGNLDFSIINPPWRERMHTYMRVCSNYAYIVPHLDREFLTKNFMPVRESGEGLIIQQLCPGYQIPEEQVAALIDLTMALDCEKINCFAPILLADACFAMK